MAKNKIIFSILFFFAATFFLHSQDHWPQLAEDMQLDKADVIKNKIRTISITVTGHSDHKPVQKHIHFNEDGRVSEYQDDKELKKFSYGYDSKKRLSVLYVISRSLITAEADTNLFTFSYEKNKVTEKERKNGYRHEYIYTDTTCSALLEEKIFWPGDVYPSYYAMFKYASGKLIEKNLAKHGTIEYKYDFSYNRQGLLSKENTWAWNNYKDNDVHYYDENNELFLSRSWHYRDGEAPGSLRNWQDITLYGQHNKWRTRYSFFNDGKVSGYTERSFGKNDLLSLEKDYHFTNKEMTSTTSEYAYEYYPD